MRLWIALSCFVPLTCFAGFSIEGSPMLSTEQGQMSRHTPYEDRGLAPFRQPDAAMAPKQQRYVNSELLVDLAYSPLTETGSGSAEIVEGFGDEVPFADGMALIIPAGWQVYKSKDLAGKDVPTVITFNGGKRWPDVLRDIALREGLQFHVDWYQRTIQMLKGRPVVAGNKRIKVIEEPSRPAPKVAAPVAATKPSTGISNSTAKASSSAVTLPAPNAAPITASIGPATSAPPKQATSPVAPKPIVPALPPETRLNVQAGYLSDNLIRLSKENGWNPPEWRMDDVDYRIKAGYPIAGKNFAEAITKLLMLHPVEAEVNTTTRKITVLKEAR